MVLMCVLEEGAGSMPRFLGQAGDSDHQCRGSSCVWRKLLCVQIFITMRQSARVARMVGVLVRCSYAAVRFGGSVNHGGGGCDQV